MWRGGDRSVELSVDGLKLAAISELKAFSPQGGTKDMWHWIERGREYQLNCYDGDRYVVVTISSHGIGVIPTSTSPDTWKW